MNLRVSKYIKNELDKQKVQSDLDDEKQKIDFSSIIKF